jgi:hypothetical protein
MRILLVGDPDDLCLAYVGWRAERRGIATTVLAEDELGVGWRLGPRDSPGGVEVGGEAVPASDIAGAVVRLNPGPELPAELGTLPEADRAFLVIERRNAISAHLDAAPFPVVNRPLAGRENGSKPLQMLSLAAHGLTVPAWIVTNELPVAREFLTACPDGAVYKAASGLRSRVRRVDDDLLGRLGRGTSPVVIQRYVRGNDVRVHLIGRNAFGARVLSDTVDYRWDERDTRYRREGVPDAVVRRCRSAARAAGLTLSGIDFRVDADGTWHCLEMNPVPTFLPYEVGAGLPIADAVLDLLTGGGRIARPRLRVVALTRTI